MMDGKKYYFSEPNGASSDFFVFLRSTDSIDSDIKLGKLIVEWAFLLSK